MEDNKFRKKIIALLVIGILLVGFIGIGISYAFFIANVNGNSNATVVTTGEMKVTFSDGSIVGSPENMLPGQSITKTFSVENTGSVYAYYDIYFNDLINTFLNNELVYELTSTNSGATISQTPMPTESGKIASNIGIEVGQVQEYTLTITFIETNENQDYNKGATFSTKLNLQEIENENISSDVEPIIVYNMTLNRSNKTLNLIYDHDVYGNVLKNYYFDSLDKCNAAINYQDEYDYVYDWQKDGANPTCEKVYSANDIADHDIYYENAEWIDGFNLADSADYCWPNSCEKLYSNGDLITKDIYLLKSFEVTSSYFNSDYDLETCNDYYGEGNCEVKFLANQNYQFSNIPLVDNLTIDLRDGTNFIVTPDLIKNTSEATYQAVQQRLNENSITNYTLNSNGDTVTFEKRISGMDSKSKSYCNFWIESKSVSCNLNDYCSGCGIYPEVSFFSNGVLKNYSSDYMS